MTRGAALQRPSSRSILQWSFKGVWNERRPGHWPSLKLVVALVSASILCACGAPRVAHERNLVFKHGKVPGPQSALRDLLDRFEAERGIRVRDETLPAASDVQHQHFITTLEGGAEDLDVVSMDVVWVPEFSRAGWLLDVTDKVSPDLRADLFPGPLEACTYKNRLYAVPWYIDGGVLYYRKDLLERHHRAVPRTYPELADSALAVLEGEKRQDLYGFLWQGKQYEGLVCSSLEVLSSFGGRVFDDGKVVIDSPEARDAFGFLRGLLSRGISPALVTTADEETTRTLFGSGKAVFMRNWVYPWNLFDRQESKVKGRVGVAPIPPGRSEKGASTLGGWQLGIYRHTHKPEDAWALVEFLTRPESQAYLTRTVGYRPSRRSLYSDPELQREIPILASLLPILEGARPRPVTPFYPALSEVLQSELSAIVAGVKDPEPALRNARAEIEFLQRDMGAER